MALGSTKKFHPQLVSAGMPETIAVHEAPRIDSRMKRAILKLYRSAKNPAEWSVDFSGIADRGLVMWAQTIRLSRSSLQKRFVIVGVSRWPMKKAPGTGAFSNAQRLSQDT